MSVLPVLDVGLALLVLGLAAWTIAARNLFAAVVGYVAFGCMLALVWVRLYAPDVALTEAAVGSGVTGVLLVTAGKRLDAAETGGNGSAARPRAEAVSPARWPCWSQARSPRSS